MKNLIRIVLVCIMIMSMTACANTRRFESESAMMEQLNGMWVMDDTYEDKTYYVFHNSEVYNFNDVQFCGIIEELFSSFVADEKIGELSKLDYKSAMDTLGVSKFLGNPEDIIAKPKNGMIIVDEGKTYETQIIITEGGVFVKAIGEDEGISLTKLSNTADFTGEHFTELFEKTKKNYTIPTYTFLKTPAEYAQMYVDELIFEKQISETSYKLYHMNGHENGVFAWDDVSFLYTTGKAASSDGDPTFQLFYKPNADSTQLIISEKLWPDFEHLLDKYAMPILSGIPGTIGTEEIMTRFEQEGKTENGVRTYSATDNGIQYSITIDYNKYITALNNYVPSENPQSILIMISFSSSMKLSSIDVDALATLSWYCSQCGKYAPDAIFSEDWQPGDICYGCSRDDLHGGKVFCPQCGADCTYRGLVETEIGGICEDCYAKAS